MITFCIKITQIVGLKCLSKIKNLARAKQLSVKRIIFQN